MTNTVNTRMAGLAAWALIAAISSEAAAQQAPPAKCKSLADNCPGITDVGPAIAPTTQGYRRVGKSNIYITGRTPDGKYNIYNLRTNGDPTLGPWTVGNTLYKENDLIKLLDGVDPKDDGHGYSCEAVCVDKRGNVVGVLATYKKLSSGKNR